MKKLVLVAALLGPVLSLLKPTPSQAKSVSVMAYNVENLFDTQHDEGKEDYTYLPKKFKDSSKEVKAFCATQSVPQYRKDCYELDWSESVLSKKIRQIAKVIKSVSKSGPDIIVFEEVENLNVLKKLRDEGLAGMGYDTIVLLEGQDPRGIDVGMLSKFPLEGDAKLHKLNLKYAYGNSGKKDRGTRGILEATFNVKGKLLTVTGHHWSSQSNPPETRVVAARKLAAIAKLTKNPLLALGDFNTTDADSPHGINQYIINTRKKVNFKDVHLEAQRAGVPDQGTHYYRGHWEVLDRIFVYDQNFPELKVDWASYNVIKKNFMLDKNGAPMRFNPKNGQGMSDHLPITVELELD